MIVPVVLAGGSGTRLWPLSREQCPKQLLSLEGRDTMFQETLRRLEGLDDTGRPVVVCTEPHRFMVAEQLRAVGLAAEIILEPADLDTAPAVAVAALQALEQGADPLLLVLPSDHQINQLAAFVAAVNTGLAPAEDGCLVTFGIMPEQPETGYGYIQPAEESWRRLSYQPSDPSPFFDPSATGAADCFPVLRFVEKPDAATARKYLEEGYLWNSGIFLFRASVLLAELAAHAPEISARMSEAYQGRQRDQDFIRLPADSFAASPALSIDRAVLERTSKAVVVPLFCGWRDVGSWSGLWDGGAADANGNVQQGRVVSRDSRNCYARSTGRLLALLGVDDLVVVETADAVLVAHRERVQEVRELVRELKERGLKEAFQSGAGAEKAPRDAG
ncbi:mannose-1-phosphate guanylyltransferase/mannose-6-phosphate isomerase [Desulfurivibrio dismutans]|uniref:mannose-1-phosphate guanylyltransferase/mannose-6-phosphate isomerase n=1 Tax=Desulfurivibrio dismutans TaxID=1398908 RepID=UPI0023D9F3B6|nr:mannose-1-phosphate guanylyltransferase/mannose-6-phosphate isomerase [Desulfurivibrio alkaliphilus]MDF1615437.1 mannose-1-phosphate guanylyltransferase/mannose-6-phosphate isomerase [Desulfurivibrio alkaliphilus]